MMVAEGNPGIDARKSNAAVAIARAFYFLKNEKDPRQAIQWIIKVEETSCRLCKIPLCHLITASCKG